MSDCIICGRKDQGLDAVDYDSGVCTCISCRERIANCPIGTMNWDQVQEVIQVLLIIKNDPDILYSL